jgi:ATP-dependent Zn protease
MEIINVHTGIKHRSELELTAYHEAGHAVVAIHLHRGVKSVTVVPNPETNSLGHCEYHELPNKEERLKVLERGDRQRSRPWLEREIILLLAGNHAEDKVKGRWNHRGASDDMSKVFDLASSMCGSNDETLAYVRWLSERARNEVESLWPLIEKVAQALVVKKTMTGREVRQIYRAWF